MSDGLLDPDALDDVAPMSMPEDGAGVVPQLAGVAGHLDPAGLAPAAHRHLGLHHHRVADGVGRRHGLVDRVGHRPRRHGDARAGEELLALVLEQVHCVPRLARRARRGSDSSQSVIVAIVVPGVKMAATPSSLRAAMSGPGMMPPPNTQRRRPPRGPQTAPSTLGNSVMWAPESMDRPDGVGVLLDDGRRHLLGRLVQARVDDLEARRRASARAMILTPRS